MSRFISLSSTNRIFAISHPRKIGTAAQLSRSPHLYFCRAALPGRQLDDEGRTFPHLARHCDVSAHHVAKAATDSESQPGSAIAAGGGGIRLGKVAKQFGHLL